MTNNLEQGVELTFENFEKIKIGSVVCIPGMFKPRKELVINRRNNEITTIRPRGFRFLDKLLSPSIEEAGYRFRKNQKDVLNCFEEIHHKNSSKYFRYVERLKYNRLIRD